LNVRIDKEKSREVKLSFFLKIHCKQLFFHLNRRRTKKRIYSIQLNSSHKKEIDLQSIQALLLQETRIEYLKTEALGIKVGNLFHNDASFNISNFCEKWIQPLNLFFHITSNQRISPKIPKKIVSELFKKSDRILIKFGLLSKKLLLFQI